VDHNAAFPNQLQDYNCLQRTYDFGSGNHEGTDIIYWPYAWRSMDEGIMEIVAAAPGIIINKRNAYPDRSCLNNGNLAWNGIIVEHAMARKPGTGILKPEVLHLKMLAMQLLQANI
jgi:hypothetical protein